MNLPSLKWRSSATAANVEAGSKAPITFCNWAQISCASIGRVSTVDIYPDHSITISAPFPQAICDLTELVYFVIECVELYGSIPSCINNLSNLIGLYLADTNLLGPLPGFPYHPKLSQITITRNQISGSIPSSLLTVPNLLYMDLSSNYLTGTIPPALVHNSSSLILLNNSLSVELPQCYGWVNFDTFVVGGNRLSGDASFLFGKQKTASIIYLSLNDFKFDLSYVQIHENLTVLGLSHNKIWGRVPNSLASSDRLLFLDLSCSN